MTEQLADLVDFDVTINEFIDYSVNFTAAYQTLQVGAYSDLFAYECCLIIALIIGEYLNIRLIRACRFHFMFLFEAFAMALGISGFAAYASRRQEPTKIAYAALVMIVVNLAFSLLDMLLCFKNRALHTLHLLVANAALWIGCIATTAWYRDNLQQHGYADIWVFSFICMWGGAMIALPAPGVFAYLYGQQGPYNPDWVAVSPAEIARRAEEEKRKAEKDAKKKEKEAQKEKEKEAKKKKSKGEKDKPEETEMAITDREFVTVHVNDDGDSSDSDTEKRKKKKKRAKKDKRDRDREEDGDEKEKPKKDKSGKKKDKDKDKDKDKGKKSKDKEKTKKKSKQSESDSD